jgi:GTP-binding protein
VNRKIVAIVGRPNVGKSTLFNRLIKQRKAIVDDRPGITRDRIYASCQWNRREFLLVDTGGFVPNTTEDITVQVSNQVLLAIDQADLVLFMVDAAIGIQTDDRNIANKLKRNGKKTILVANKVDSEKNIFEISEFYNLGLGEIYPVSAANGRLIGELLDAIAAALPVSDESEAGDLGLKIAIVGRPNVGKSSLFNAILGEKRQIVSSIPGTTRDSIDSQVEIGGRAYVFVDTAGLRKKSQFPDTLEYWTTLRSLKAIERSDIVLAVLDSQSGFTVGDIKIADYADNFGKGVIFIANKWDLVKGVPQEDFIKIIRQQAPMLAYIPVVFSSAIKGAGIEKIIKAIIAIDRERKKHLKTSDLNEFLQMAIGKRQPPAKAGKLIKFNYVTQAEGIPPTFVFFCTHPKFLDPSYRRFLENRLREQFGFDGTPIKLVFKARKKP